MKNKFKVKFEIEVEYDYKHQRGFEQLFKARGSRINNFKVVKTDLQEKTQLPLTPEDLKREEFELAKKIIKKALMDSGLKHCAFHKVAKDYFNMMSNYKDNTIFIIMEPVNSYVSHFKIKVENSKVTISGPVNNRFSKIVDLTNPNSLTEIVATLKVMPTVKAPKIYNPKKRVY